MNDNSITVPKKEPVLFMLNKIPGYDHNAAHNYDKNAQKFAGIAGLEKIKIYPFIERAFNEAALNGSFDRQNDKILDIGCGPFLLALPFLRRGIAVDGVDSSKNMLKVAKDNLKKTNLGYVSNDNMQEISSMRDVPCAEYGFAMMNFVHQCSPNRKSLDKLFQVAFKALKPGSTLYITGAHPDHLDVPHSLCEYDIDDVSTMKEGQRYTGRIYQQDGTSYDLSGNHFWQIDSLKKAARKAGFNFSNGDVEKIEDVEVLSPVRQPSREAAYFGMTLTKPLPKAQVA